MTAGTWQRCEQGFSYIEVLVAVVLLAVCLAPALEALRETVSGTAVGTTATQEHYDLVGRMEQVLAQPFDLLDAAALAAGSPTTPSSYSDPSGSTPRVLVYLSRYDGDNADGDNNPFTGVDPDLLWIQVKVQGTNAVLTTLRRR